MTINVYDSLQGKLFCWLSSDFILQNRTVRFFFEEKMNYKLQIWKHQSSPRIVRNLLVTHFWNFINCFRRRHLLKLRNLGPQTANGSVIICNFKFTCIYGCMLTTHPYIHVNSKLQINTHPFAGLGLKYSLGWIMHARTGAS